MQLFKRKIFGSGTTIIISAEKMNDIMIIIKSLKDSGLLIKGVSEKIKNKAKEQKGEFLGILLGTLGASLLRNIFAGNRVVRCGEGVIGTGKGTNRACLVF